MDWLIRYTLEKRANFVNTYYLKETGNPKQVSVAIEISNNPQIRIDSVHLNKFCILLWNWAFEIKTVKIVLKVSNVIIVLVIISFF